MKIAIISGSHRQKSQSIKVAKHINWTLAQLREYAIALKQVRESGVTQTDKFGNGM